MLVLALDSFWKSIPVMMATESTAGGSVWSGRKLRSSSLLLLILAIVSSCRAAAGDEEAANAAAAAVRPRGYIRQSSGNIAGAGDNWSTFGDKHDAGELEPLVGMPGRRLRFFLRMYCRGVN